MSEEGIFDIFNNNSKQSENNQFNYQTNYSSNNGPSVFERTARTIGRTFLISMAAGGTWGALISLPSISQHSTPLRWMVQSSIKKGHYAADRITSAITDMIMENSRDQRDALNTFVAGGLSGLVIKSGGNWKSKLFGTVVGATLGGIGGAYFYGIPRDIFSRNKYRTNLF